MSFLSRLIKSGERCVGGLGNLAWDLLGRLDQRRPPPPLAPRWAGGQRPGGLCKPPIGWPRRTDSLCPVCTRELRERILAGELDVGVLRTGNPAGIAARIVEEDGRLWMVKECRRHGRFVDLLSVDPAFTARIERLAPARPAESPPSPLRDHGPSTIRYGRGAVLTVDLTNRCNMMCEPCFTDANQTGVVHELAWDDVRRILDDSLTVEPRRQMTVQFSGGEPTLSPHFIPALRYARDLGYISLQVATNGVRFAREAELATRAKAAGLRLAYLQFDGVGNEANRHRKVANLFEVKQRAIDNLRRAGVDVVLVTTVINSVNDDQVGRVLDFAVDNIDAVTTVAFQPVSFTGRDELAPPAQRQAQRYTLSHLAADLGRHTGYLEPMRDWFPLSALSAFSDVTDTLLGEQALFGSINCGCHPSCGVGTVLMVHKRTKEVVPLSRFLDVEGLLEDLPRIAGVRRSKLATLTRVAAALLRRFDPYGAPDGLDAWSLVRQYLSQTGGLGLGVDDAEAFPWRALFIGGMWFQDLYNYDFRRTEMCIVPYGTQLGEISFCAYNTGIGWRKIVEQRFGCGSTRRWYQEHGRHEVYASGGAIPLPLRTARAVGPIPVEVAEEREGAGPPLGGKPLMNSARLDNVDNPALGPRGKREQGARR